MVTDKQHLHNEGRRIMRSARALNPSGRHRYLALVVLYMYVCILTHNICLLIELDDICSNQHISRATHKRNMYSACVHIRI